MPIPANDQPTARVARLVDAITTGVFARLCRLARRTWSRILVAICLAEPPYRPALFRVRPPSLSPLEPQRGVSEASPGGGRVNPFAHLANRLALRQGSTGTIMHRHQMFVAPNSGPAQPHPGPHRPARRRMTSPYRSPSRNARPDQKRPFAIRRPNRPGRHQPDCLPVDPSERSASRTSGNWDHATSSTWPMPGWVGAEERACDLGEALILVAGLAGASLGGTLVGSFGACLGLLVGLMLGGSYVEQRGEDSW